MRTFWQRGGRPLAFLGAAAFVAPRQPSSWSGSPRAAVVAASSGGAVLVRNGEASAPWLSKNSLLHDYHGAYTTARTVDKSSVFELGMHCQRLYDGGLDVLTRQASEAASKASLSRQERLEQARNFLDRGGLEALRPILKSEMLVALDYVERIQAADSSDKEFQVTMLLTCDMAGDHTPSHRGFDVLTYVQPLPYVEPMVAVEAHRAERRNPTIKDVQWVNDRKELEDIQKTAAVNEVIMYDSAGVVTEGLQTNFFAVAADGTLLTAPADRVLSGTVRKVVLDVAKEHAIPVRLECPSIKDLDSWESCFICSTSRLVKPIRELGAPEFSSARRKFPASGSVAHRVEALVLDAVRSHSESLRE